MKPRLPSAPNVAAVIVALLCGYGCAARPPTAIHGIELEQPNELAQLASSAAVMSADSTALEPSSAEAPADSTGPREAIADSRWPPAERVNAVAQLPIHINETWWPVRARHLGTTELEAKRRDAQVGAARPPEGFWDSQTAVEAVSVWTVLCNQCHGGRRSVEDLGEMPEPPLAWGRGTGLFFGKRRAYSQLFSVVHDGGPPSEDERIGMPAWRSILPNEMIWALLYFLEYQSGGSESRFPPSLYPRPSK